MTTFLNQTIASETCSLEVDLYHFNDDEENSFLQFSQCNLPDSRRAIHYQVVDLLLKNYSNCFSFLLKCCKFQEQFTWKSRNLRLRIIRRFSIERSFRTFNPQR